jgi:hypothetical protein
MAKNRFIATSVAALLVLATVGAPLSAADHRESDASGVFDGVTVEEDKSADNSSVMDSVRRTVSRLAGAASGALSRITDRGTDQTASEAADSAQAEFNTHNGTIQRYINERSDASTGANVLELTFKIDDGEATRYVVADVNGSDYENATMVSQTSREVDETCTLEDQAGDNAAAELETFVADYGSEKKNMPAGYQRRLASQYGGEVGCSFEVR